MNHDLTVTDRIKLGRNYGTVDPYDQSTIDRAMGEISLPYALESFRRGLFETCESLTVPAGKLGIVGLRSTWARLGMMTPPTYVDPGFRGTLTLEGFNASNMPLLIRPGDAIWSIVFVDTDDAPYEGRYQNQSGIRQAIALERKASQAWLRKAD